MELRMSTASLLTKHGALADHPAGLWVQREACMGPLPPRYCAAHTSRAKLLTISFLWLQVETYTAADAGVIELMDDHDRAQQDDPLSKLEKGTEMRAKRVDLKMRLSALQEDSHGRYENDYEMNRMMRKRMR